MELSEKFLQSSYAFSIAVFVPISLYDIAQYFHLASSATLLFMGLVGAVLLILGLFIFQQGLSFGLTLAGVIAATYGSVPFWHKVSNVWRFGVALLILSIVLFALYRLVVEQKRK